MTSTRLETAFGGGWPWGQSGAQSKKPRVMRGSERLTTRLSELTGLVLAAQNIPHHKLPKILMGKQIKHLVSSSSF